MLVPCFYRFLILLAAAYRAQVAGTASTRLCLIPLKSAGDDQTGHIGTAVVMLAPAGDPDPIAYAGIHQGVVRRQHHVLLQVIHLDRKHTVRSTWYSLPVTQIMSRLQPLFYILNALLKIRFRSADYSLQYCKYTDGYINISC